MASSSAPRDDDARSAVWDMQSIAGTTPTPTREADLLPWIRPALGKVGYTETEYNNLVNMLGRAVAAEVILLMVGRCCTAQEAKNLGCPWVVKTWAATRLLQNQYNQLVTQLQSIPERAVLSDSSSSTRPAARKPIQDDESLASSLIRKASTPPDDLWHVVDSPHEESKILDQVRGAWQLLSRSTLTGMRVAELRRTCAPLNDLLDGVLNGQLADQASAQEALQVLTEFANERGLQVASDSTGETAETATPE